MIDNKTTHGRSASAPDLESCVFAHGFSHFFKTKQKNLAMVFNAVSFLFHEVPRTMAEGGKDDDELNIPRAALNKMIKELVPNIRIANDSRELILNCCTEFIHLLSSEANDICNKQQKKTISPEHILAGA